MSPRGILPSAYCLLPTAFCLLPTAYCLLPSAYCLLPTATAYCLLPTAHCLLPRSYCLLRCYLVRHRVYTRGHAPIHSQRSRREDAGAAHVEMLHAPTERAERRPRLTVGVPPWVVKGTVRACGEGVR